MGLVAFLIICLVGIVVLQFGFIFIMLAMMPAIVAWYTDTDRKHSVFKIIGCGNLAAGLSTFAPIVQSAFHSKRFDVESVITDPSVWLFIYLGAGSGWGMIYLCRFISRFVVTMTYEYNISTLKKQQQRLIAEWGPEIALTDESEQDNIEY